jgi:hypothetical protein
MTRTMRSWAAAVVLCAVAACGGGGGGDGDATADPTSWQPPASFTPPGGNYIYLQSDAGDYIGAGGTYVYTSTSAILSVSTTAGTLRADVQGDERWAAEFAMPQSSTRLARGQYVDLQRHPFHDPARGGLSWVGEGRGCNELRGWFVVDDVAYDGDALSSIELRFEQRCENSSAALRGKVRWAAANPTSVPGPVEPPPGLWQPPGGATPTDRNFVYLQSDVGDYIGQGGTYLYTQANAVLSASLVDGRLFVTVNGSQSWRGDFQPMVGISALRTGYYAGVGRFPFNNPAKGGLDWGGEGRGCNRLTGWFSIDRLDVSAGQITAVDARFEQRCEGSSTAALRGKIVWAAGDRTVPAGPVVPPPSNLWVPSAVVLPPSGSFVYLESEFGDYIGQGGTYLYTASNAQLTLEANGAGLVMRVDGVDFDDWTGNFRAMSTLPLWQLGYYGNLQRYPFHNPTLGGLDWTGRGSGCNTLTGWMVVDAVSYSGTDLMAIDFRFEQHCEGAAPALRGPCRWLSATNRSISRSLTPRSVSVRAVRIR